MIKFGPSGNSESFYAQGYSHTEQSAKFVRDMGLDCFEYSFGRGVRMSEAKAISPTPRRRAPLSLITMSWTVRAF